jgi:hypothetical protein
VLSIANECGLYSTVNIVASFSEILLTYISVYLVLYPKRKIFKRYNIDFVPKDINYKEDKKKLVTNEIHARQTFFQILNSGGKKFTTVVIWSRSVVYSQQPASKHYSEPDESRTWTPSHLQVLNACIRVYWELEQNQETGASDY